MPAARAMHHSRKHSLASFEREDPARAEGCHVGIDVVRRGCAPGEVALHAVCCKRSHVCRFTEGAGGAIEGADEGIAAEFVEEEAGGVIRVLVEIEDGVGEAAGAPADGYGAVAHGDDLSEPAGFVARRA